MAADQASNLSQPHPTDPSPSEEERHNFALSKDGAKIIASNKEAKKASAILDTDSDTFMKNECKADKWFIIELSQVQGSSGKGLCECTCFWAHDILLIKDFLNFILKTLLTERPDPELFMKTAACSAASHLLLLANEVCTCAHPLHAALQFMGAARCLYA